MQKSAMSKAQQQFAANQKKEKQALNDKDKAEQERSDKRARLKALRLGQEKLNSASD